MSQRVEPFRTFSFKVEIRGDSTPIAYFSEVSGLGGEIEVEEYKEGGVNEFVHKLPRNAKFNNLVLKAGLTENAQLYEWFDNVANGEVELKTVVVSLLDPENMESVKKSWTFYNALPVKISATDLNAQTSGIVIESLELAHTGMIVENGGGQ